MAAVPCFVHGVDLVGVERFSRSLREHADGYALRVFTPAELGYADAHPARRGEHLAARFAAKEAVLKALGTGWSAGIGWTDIEVLRDDGGPPRLVLHGEAARHSELLGVERWVVSLSHTATHAMASVIGWGPGQ